LWCKFRKESFNRLRVAYNNALRLLLNVPPWSSASDLLIKHGATSFHSLIRYNSILFCVHWLTVKMLVLKVLLNRTDFFSPRLCRSGELTHIYNFYSLTLVFNVAACLLFLFCFGP